MAVDKPTAGKGKALGKAAKEEIKRGIEPSGKLAKGSNRGIAIQARQRGGEIMSKSSTITPGIGVRLKTPITNRQPRIGGHSN